MNKQLLAILKKMYKHDNTYYDAERGIALYKTDMLKPQETELLQQNKWAPNEIELIRHDELNRKLIGMQSEEQLSWHVVARIFIAGVGGSFPAGISTLMNYHQMIHMREHDYQEAERFMSCKRCGFHKDQWEHLSWIRYAVHLGNAYGSTIGAYAHLTELLQLLQSGSIEPTDEDKSKFKQLLQLLDAADDSETPGQFEKRLTAAKLLKGTAGMRRSILQSLAMVGVIPNRILSISPDSRVDNEQILNGELLLNNTKGRSDMEMPWAGWQGGLGVDWDKTLQLFGTCYGEDALRPTY
ncbi:hypothetical protein [Paenibacillus nasutitermitis]|uniref:Uncharacterized protein n=1 Tax=Paenibacillus nasutitermitis TaxID=1652958 RepID=A0A916ZDB3_9BACL|nr:hypothetical protein [Paenibacillus nasutitermitis]GGD89612.1 hypothetical protein GCM10010911_55280 [Paenibacillus nasutitermitis]